MAAGGFEPNATRTSYTLATMKRIRILDEVTEQTRQLAGNLRQQLEEALERTSKARVLEARRDQTKMKIRLLEEEIERGKERLKTKKDRKNTLEQQLTDRAIEMSNRFQKIKSDRESYMEKRRRLTEEKEKLSKSFTTLSIRRKQLISELTTIYPIQQIPTKPTGEMMILGVPLQDAEKLCKERSDDTHVAVALGYVRILDVPLRYMIVFNGSRSLVYDHLNTKLEDHDRHLPLFIRKSGRDRVYFNYAVYLLNHDIAQLRHYLFYFTKDLSRTLPNLHSLLAEKLTITDEDEEEAARACTIVGGRPLPEAGDTFLMREIEYLRSMDHSSPSTSHSQNGSALSVSALVNSDRHELITRSLDRGLNAIGHLSR